MMLGQGSFPLSFCHSEVSLLIMVDVLLYFMAQLGTIQCLSCLDIYVSIAFLQIGLQGHFFFLIYSQTHIITFADIFASTLGALVTKPC